MATSTSTALCDASTLTNFKAWAQLISNALAAFGWTQSADTGQVNWSTIASVPGTDAYVYEVWQPGDALTTFYVKVEYGNWGAANRPHMRLSVGTTTNGAGTMTGFSFGPIACLLNTYTTPGVAGGPFNCYFSGDASRFAALMWRDGTGSCSQFIAFERSRDSTGAYTNVYATLFCGGQQGSGNSAASVSQRTVHLTLGVTAGAICDASAAGGINVRGFKPSTGDTSFNGGIPFDPVAPTIGYWDYPHTVVGAVWGAAVAEGVAFTVSLYGSTLTFLPTKAFPLSNCVNRQTNTSAAGNWALCMRYD